MSIKTTRFKRKVAQLRRAGGSDTTVLIPTHVAKSDGRAQIFSAIEDDGTESRPRYRPGRASGLVGTLPMDGKKASRLLASCK
jgi:hypothetical protein